MKKALYFTIGWLQKEVMKLHNPMLPIYWILVNTDFTDSKFDQLNLMIDKRLWDFMPLLTKEKKVRDEDAEKNAFLYWSRSAHQNNVDARVKMCDYYYKGIGTKVNYEKAAACYRNAAEDYRSPLAYWNLGWMYENGVGVQKDLPLAKKAYDLALEYDADAYLPIKLSLLSWWKNWWLLGLKGDAEL
jgi:SEL1 protein